MIRGKVVAAIATALVLSIGAASSSNFGFKITMNLQYQAGRSNNYWISLPYRSVYTEGGTASTLGEDIPNCIQVGYLDLDTDNWVWSDRLAPGVWFPDFTLEKGKGYFVVITGDSNPVIVGSADDAYVVPLTYRPGRSNNHWLSIPYHTRAQDASDLGESIANCIQVGYLDVTTDNWVWSDRLAPDVWFPDFPLEIGKSYFAVITADSSYHPSHY